MPEWSKFATEPVILTSMHAGMAEPRRVTPPEAVVYQVLINEPLLKETVFMKNLGAAKRSAMAQAPEITHQVNIYDLMERCLNYKEMGSSWIDS